MENTEENKVVPSMSADHIFAITELARIGFEFMKESMKGGKPDEISDEAFEHYKSLVEVAGPSALTHFSNICQYLYETEQGKEGESSVEVPIDGGAKE